ncbi:MAG: hypothetical protein GWN30_08305 [Gammaproteobacteria bacterium]|nr:hypothetical protein [Gammaproteobacteria bacterium]
MLAFDGFYDVGDAYIYRNDRGITAQGMASGVAPGVYTMWWVVWNAPENCNTAYACLEPDLFNSEVRVAIGYAGGAMTDKNGNFMISAHLSEGETLTGFPYPEFQALGLQLNDTTMIDSRHAEIHLVFRYHGIVEPMLLSTAMHTFNGGCEYTIPISGSEPAYGTPGSNICVDTHFVIFPSEDTP